MLFRSEEGAVQVFRPVTSNDYVLGAVGALQFDVTMARLRDEYGVEAAYEPYDAQRARWIDGERKNIEEFEKKNAQRLARDTEGNLTFLSPSEWQLNYTIEQWPDIAFHRTKEHSS